MRKSNPKILLPQLDLSIEAIAGETLFDTLMKEGVLLRCNLDTPCGGKKTCRKCRVMIDGKEELACCFEVTKNIKVVIASEAKQSALFFSNADCFASLAMTKKLDTQIAALDIGTTTIALETSTHSAYFLNPQKIYGADVITRINACNEGHFDKLRTILIDSIKDNLKCADEHITVITAANAAMLHMLAGVDPRPIGVAPYKAVFTDTREVIVDNVTFVLLPSAGAFVGADVVAGVLSSGMYQDGGNSILIDLGTNGEIVLKADGNYYGASAAAGPALEGGNISCGTFSSDTAVSSVQIKDNQIIVDKPDSAVICGAGLIDLVACLLERGDIDETGATPEQMKVANITLTAKDIREVQLAKAAINATILALIKAANITADDINKVYLAGGLGKGLNPKNAERIGLIPKGFAQKTKAIGNSSLQGAKMCAANPKLIKTCEEIARKIKILELTQNADFFELYTQAIMFD